MLLSQLSTKIGTHYDVIVIGSGYGGSVAASRLSRSGKRVAVLERGKEFQANDFSGGSLLQDLEIRVRNRSFGPKISGISEMTVNAAVMIVPEPRVFQGDRWPMAIRSDAQTGHLNKYFDRAREMLKVVPYPQIPETGKSQLFRNAAEKAGMGEYLTRPDLAVTFSPTGSNDVGIPQAGTDLSGDLIMGNRSGAKNSTTKNYLPDSLRNMAQRSFVVLTCDMWRK